MNFDELILKTAFCCMACDGNIAEEEVDFVRRLSGQFSSLPIEDVEHLLKNWIEEINQKGLAFLKSYIAEVKSERLSSSRELSLVEVAFKTIEADNRIEYAEVKFFKKIRRVLSLSDEEILTKYPDKEDFLLPDIVEDDSFLDSMSYHFDEIKIIQNDNNDL